MFDSVNRWFSRYFNSEAWPEPFQPTKHDPFIGLGERKQRVVHATMDELRAAKIPKSKWDYCADHLLEVEKCKMDTFPFVWKCKDKSHSAVMCYFDDQILRMQEFERERRLIARELRIKKKQEQQ